MAAPLRSNDNIVSSDKPHWIDPCSLDEDRVLNPSDELKVKLPNVDSKSLFEKIFSRSEAARKHAVEVRKNFVNTLFKDPSFEDDTFHMTYDWLPIVPKLSPELLHNLTDENALRESYMYMQYYAVGLEQVRLDQTLFGGMFQQEAKLMEAKIRQVLCELRLSMYVLNVQPNEDVTRKVMSTRLRMMGSETTRHFRDYIIMREYAKGLEYIEQVFGHFITKSLGIY